MDTYKVVELLKDKGYTKKEAEGFIQAMQEITLSGVATKQDIDGVRTEMQELGQELRNEILDVRAEITKLELKMIQGFSALDSKIEKSSSDNLKFQLIQTIAIIGVMVALFSFFGP